MKSSTLLLSSLVSISLLNGCGGSDASTEPTPIAPTINPIEEITILDDVILQNQAVELFIRSPQANQIIDNIHWQQTSGEVLPILSASSTTISLLPTAAGSYQFQVDYTVNGASFGLTRTFNVTDENALLSIHSGHSVVEGNKVSLRVHKNDVVNESDLQWQQVDGPAVALEQGDNATNLVIYFNAPDVSQDTVVSFQVTDSVSGASDIASVLVENKSTITTNAYFDEPVATVFPYNANSPYADSIVGCVYSNQLTSSCKLSTLPLIAQETTTPTVDDIMNRVVVSHQWMGDRFKSFLENYDTHNDFKNLLRATTAIVLSYDIRPSFYWAATGAIYLDAENLWITALERDTINEAPDYRSAFGKDLQFARLWRYVNGNDYAYKGQSRDNRAERNIEDGLHRLTTLLYHELGHANDFFPKAEWQGHDSDSRVLDAATSTNFESDKLSARYPLSSQIMRNLAQVSFAGASSTSTQRNYTPETIGDEFSSDNASDYYSYLSEREDLAMLFEELMMQARYGIRRDVAITNLPQGDSISATDYIVSWGQRGRVAEPEVALRTEYVTTRILPEFDATEAITNLPSPIAMTIGYNWIENLTLSPEPSPSSRQPAMTKPETKLSNNQQINHDFLYGHKDLPKH